MGAVLSTASRGQKKLRGEQKPEQVPTCSSVRVVIFKTPWGPPDYQTFGF